MIRLVVVLAFCALAPPQAQPQIRYPGPTREAALRCPGAGCLGVVTVSPGEQVTFWVAGTNLRAATGIAFKPPDGIAVSAILAADDAVQAIVSVAPNAVPGSRPFVVLSPGGASNESSGELNISTFRISNLKIDNVVNTDGTLKFTVTLDYADPTGAVSSGTLDIMTSLNFGGRVTGGLGSEFKPDGRRAGAKNGTMSFTQSYENMRGTTGAIFSISLGARDGRQSDKLQAVF